MAVYGYTDRKGPNWAGFLALTLGFAMLDWVCMGISRDSAHVPTLRPLCGIAAGLCLSFRPADTWKFVAAAVAASALARIASFGLPGVMLPNALLLGASILLTCGLTRRFLGEGLGFRSWKETLGFLAISAIVAIPLGAAYAAWMFWSTGRDFAMSWLTWSLCTSLSYAVFAPPIMIFGKPGRATLVSQGHKLALSIAIMAVVLTATFAQSFTSLLYLIPLAVMVVTLLTEVEGTALALAATSLVALAATASGHGPMKLLSWSEPDNLLWIEIFLAFQTIILLPIASAITERQSLKRESRQAWLEARHSAQTLEHIIDAITDHAIYMLDSNGKVVTWNRGAERTKGYRTDEILGRHFSCFFPQNLREEGLPTRLLAEAARQGRAQDENWRQRKDGSLFWAGGSLHAVRDSEGRLSGFAEITRDLTSRKREEDALARAKEQAEAAAQVKADFLANMSHEIRTPLTSIIGFADLLHARDDLAPRAKAFTDHIRTGARALLVIINDVLDYSRLESGQITLNPQQVCPREIVQDAVELLQVQALAKGLTLHLEYSADIAGLNVHADPERLRQILFNLTGNAIKFTNEGRVTLRLSQPGSDRLRFEVADTGPGIEAEEQKKLFQRFSRLEMSAGRSREGTGLGLAICKGLVEAMQGEIGVTSESGQGTTFWFEIQAPPTLDAIAREDGTFAIDPMPPTRILVVDDNAANRALASAALNIPGWEIQVACSGEEAVTMARTEQWDLILMDIHMQGMGGLAAMKAIRGLNGNAAVPIVAFTANAKPGSIAELLDSGFTDLITKPLPVPSLRAQVTRILQSLHSGRENSNVA